MILFTNLELTSFLMHVTGKRAILKKTSIEVRFIDDDKGAITAHTCGHQIVFPRNVFLADSYNMFEMAMRAVISVDVTSKDTFNTV